MTDEACEFRFQTYSSIQCQCDEGAQCDEGWLLSRRAIVHRSTDHPERNSKRAQRILYASDFGRRTYQLS
jgi:hypothetical protein